MFLLFCAADIWENSVGSGSGENSGGGGGLLCTVVFSRFCGDGPLLLSVCEQEHMRVAHSQGAHILPSSSFDSVGGIVDGVLFLLSM